jgi:hypothetical protein
MTAKIIANELKLGLYKIDLAGVVSKYIDETEKNLDRIFSVAENVNAILFSTRPMPCSISAPKCATLTTATPTSKLAICSKRWKNTRESPFSPVISFQTRLADGLSER